MIHDNFIEGTPFFTDAQRSLAVYVADFVAREIEPRAAEEKDAAAHFRARLRRLR